MVVPDRMAIISGKEVSVCARPPVKNPAIYCEWRPPEDVPMESPPAEYPPGIPEEEPFVPETEPPPPPEEIPRETAALNKDIFSRHTLARNNNIHLEVNNYVRG